MSPQKVKKPTLSPAPVSSTNPEGATTRTVEIHGTTGVYTVREFTDGRWHCTCLAWKNNHASPLHRHCKHTRQVQRGNY